MRERRRHTCVDVVSVERAHALRRHVQRQRRLAGIDQPVQAIGQHREPGQLRTLRIVAAQTHGREQTKGACRSDREHRTRFCLISLRSANALWRRLDRLGAVASRFTARRRKRAIGRGKIRRGVFA